MSSKNTTEKKAPSTPKSTKSKKEVASPTPRSIAMSAMPFYSSVGEVSLPKMDEETKDAMKARAVVNAVFTKEEKDKAVKRHFENTFDYPLFTESDMSDMAEIDYLKGRSERSEDLQDLDKMEMAVSMANRGQEMKRMSPDQIELEVAHELLDLKKAAPGLDREIGDRSTPIPDIGENMFSSSAENTPVKRSKRKKGGMPLPGTYDKIKKDQKKKFIELLERTESWNDVNSRYKAYLRQDGVPDLLSKEDKLLMFDVTEKAILDTMGARRGGTRGLSQKDMLKQQKNKFQDLLEKHVGFEETNIEFKKYLKETNQPEFLTQRMRVKFFNDIEKGIAEDFELDTHEVRDHKGGKRIRRMKRTRKKRHLKKSTKSRKTKRKNKRSLKK
jgi:hypothetical protein